MIDPAFGHWLAGFTDGEGSFSIDRDETRANGKVYRTCRYRLTVRVDDLPILQTIQRKLGMGNISVVWHRSRKGSHENPAAYYAVGRLEDARKVVAIFTRYSLRARKAAQFTVWAEAVAEMSKGEERSDTVVEQLKARLSDLHSYIPIEENDDHRAQNPISIRRKGEYGEAPLCLCGCGEKTGRTNNAKNRKHPDNPHYCSYIHGHHLRLPDHLAALHRAKV